MFLSFDGADISGRTVSCGEGETCALQGIQQGPGFHPQMLVAPHLPVRTTNDVRHCHVSPGGGDKPALVQNICYNMINQDREN